MTAIIGKNESGKSNVLDGLSMIDFLKSVTGAFSADIVNRNSVTGTENKYTIILKPDASEAKNGLRSDTLIEISNDHCIITGGFFDYYLQNVLSKFKEVVAFLDRIGENPMQLRGQELTDYRSFKQELSQDECLDSYRKMRALDFFRAREASIPVESREAFRERFKCAHDAWSSMSYMLPVFFTGKRASI